ncbi:hypothetical protein Tco_0688331 [Tanacetum coccineum]
MAALKFASSHNMVAFLDKPTESDGFEQIVDFLNAHPIKYALTVNPTIYTSCIKQFWTTAEVKTVNGEVHIQALVDKKKVIITETSIRSDLQLEDAEGTECLPNATIFEQLTLMGYENLTQKLTFYKAFFLPQWKFLIHTILQCLSAKTTAWNDLVALWPLLSSKKQPRRKQKKDTEVSQPSDSTEPIAYEAPNDENVTTHSNDPLLSEITKLKERVKKLEKRNKSRTLGLKRLRKVGKIARIESSEDDGLGGVLDEQEVKVKKVVSTAEVTTTSATTTTIDELTLAQTLIEIKPAKPKAVTTAATTTTTAVTRPKDRGVVVQELKGSKKRTREELKFDNSKKQKIDENVEAEVDDEAEMKKLMEIVPDDEVAIDAIPLATKSPIIVDLKIIKKGKMGYFQIIRADGSSMRPDEAYERVLWGDLKVMFEPDVESEVWRNLQGYNVTV